MKFLYAAPLLVPISLFPACTPETAVKVICGVAEVALENSESNKIKKAFGSDSFGSKVCELFTGPGRVLSTEPAMISVQLPTGETATAVVSRSITVTE